MIYVKMERTVSTLFIALYKKTVWPEKLLKSLFFFFQQVSKKVESNKAENWHFFHSLWLMSAVSTESYHKVEDGKWADATDSANV